MNSELTLQIYQTWARHFQLPMSRLATPGTTLCIHEPSETGSYFTLWPLDKHVIVETVPAVAEQVKPIMALFPSGYRLTYADFEAVWGETEHRTMILYALDPALFRPFPLPAPYVLRQVGDADQAAYEAFEAQCSEADRFEVDTGIPHIVNFGIFDGARTVAASGISIWRGFIEISILTDPHYRGQGLGKASVSACISRYLNGDKVVSYRHDGANLPSQRIALALGYSCYTVVDVIMPPMN